MNDPGMRALTTKRLVLRRFTEADADAMYANWANDPAVTRYLTWDVHPDKEITRVLLQTWVAQYDEGGYYNWVITLDGMPIGNIAIVNCSAQDENAEIGYALGKRWWGQGLMSEALARVLQYLFEDLALHRVYLKYDTQNIGSGRVMQKNGLREEGLLREHMRRKDDSFGDVRFYGILREEWLTRQKEGSHGNLL